ncbi:MAG: helix-turn-helix transcriptional regulator [Mycobacteriales bacterium]|nr:helix-turn-helix domain-containing protein [Frankia sp.]
MGGDLIREARRRAGLTQAQLAERAGTTQSAVARWESGRTSPSVDTLLRLLRLCGFRLDVALDRYDDSDLAQAQSLLRIPVEARAAELRRMVLMLEDMREDAQRSMARAGSV